MLQLTSVALLAILPAFLTTAAPTLDKRTVPLTGDGVTGDVSTEPYDTYKFLPGAADGAGAGKCGLPYPTLSNLDYVVAIDGVASPLDIATQCNACIEVSASQGGAAPKTVHLTVIDQRNYGKPGLDISTPAFRDLFGATTGRYCKDCVGLQGGWDINWKPVDASMCSAKWNGQCAVGHAPTAGKYCA